MTQMRRITADLNPCLIRGYPPHPRHLRSYFLNRMHYAVSI